MEKTNYPATPKEVYESILDVQNRYKKKLSESYELDLDSDDVEFIRRKLKYIEQYLKDNY
ncbi:MAG TPA: hypothetical protein PKI34_05985 [Bacteroidales bacterium]|nr:hypothetical protein [Bacteroidales bacterium]